MSIKDSLEDLSSICCSVKESMESLEEALIGETDPGKVKRIRELLREAEKKRYETLSRISDM